MFCEVDPTEEFQSLIGQVYLSDRYDGSVELGYELFQSLINQVYLSDLEVWGVVGVVIFRFNPLLIRSTFQTEIVARISMILGLFQSLINQVYLPDCLVVLSCRFKTECFNPLLIRSTFQTILPGLGILFGLISFNPLLIRPTFQTSWKQKVS